MGLPACAIVNSAQGLLLLHMGLLRAHAQANAPHGSEEWQRQRAACLAAFESEEVRFKELSGVMWPDLEWDIVQRNGDASVCLGEGHRFFFVLFLYRHWRTHSGTADFGACVPRGCDEAVVRDEILLAMYRHFFEVHTDYRDDGTIDAATSVAYSFTLKEYRSGLVVTEALRGPALLGVALCALPPLLATLLDEARRCPALCERKGGANSCVSPGPKAPSGFALLVEAFSLRRSFQTLVAAGGRDSAGLCRLRVGLTAALLVLHATQGSKWRDIGELERAHPVFRAVRPLAMVQDAFLLLSAYLCSWSHLRSEARLCGVAESSSWVARLRRNLTRASYKYARQLPLCLLWAWVYVAVLPSLPYNMYNHSYPWFGVKWFHSTGKCMMRKWRYAFLLGDVSMLLYPNADWLASNGNPCGNLWNFQIEIEERPPLLC